MINNIVSLGIPYVDNTEKIETLFEELKTESVKVQHDSFEFFKFMLTYSTKAKDLLVFTNTPDESEELQLIKHKFRKEFQLLENLINGRNLHSELSLAVMHLSALSMDSYILPKYRETKILTVERSLGRLEMQCKFDKDKSLELEKIKELQQWLKQIKEEDFK